VITRQDLEELTSREALDKLLEEKHIDISKPLATLAYENELRELQVELTKLQRWIQEKELRVAVVFEGRDASGKGGAIRRFKEHLNPRSMRVVALNKPTEQETKQWYFRRYIKELPQAGEIVFFDRSWYNRAVVEPVMGFCSLDQYERFMQQVPQFEQMLIQDGVFIIKFWFSITKQEQQKRFESRRKNPLKMWKLSPVDVRGQELWNDYTHYKYRMFEHTHTHNTPWTIIQTDDKKTARLQAIKYVLSRFNYKDKEPIQFDTSIVFPYRIN
jgi:polyphosphate kinase 2